jgi:putative ABC transport system substrate-binding protein
MRRREFVALVGAAAAWPLTVRAQQPAIPVIGFLYLGSERSVQPGIEAFRSGLAALGYREGENIRVLYRFAEGSVERLSTLAVELVSLGAKIIVTGSTTAIRAVHDAVPNVAIVSWGSADPVMMGWAQTVARPGGMITGLFLFASTVAKPVELLKEVRPQASTFGYLFHAANPGNPHFRRIVDDVAGALGIKVEIIEVKEQTEIPDVFNRMGSLGAEGLAIIADPVLGSHLGAIAELARLHKLPSVGLFSDFVDAGGLLALSPNFSAMAKRSAWFVDQILKGTAPGDLPAEQHTDFKLFVNLKTAKELGITIPAAILARADEVIE